LTLAALCLAAALIVPFAYFGTYIPFALACLAVLVFVILVERLRLGDGRRELPVVIAAFLFPAVLVGVIVALRSGAQGFAWIVFVFAVVEANDSFALLGGKLFGRHRILPRLSPRKTAEGLIVGIVFGAAAGVLLGQHLLGLSLPHSLFLTAGALAAGLAGDLISSALKRSRGKKDFPPVLSAHGGMLDIYDSFLFAAPVVALLRPLLT
jgi:phosphatidate cytidylyltransferase